MPSLVILSLDKAVDTLVKPCSVAGWMQVYVLSLDGAKEPLDKGIVGCSSLAVHADLNSFFFQERDPMLTGVLAALV